MKLESLPNEIFHDIFEYFDAIELFHIFYGLNLRFNDLLYKQYHLYYLNFESTSKRKFDTICQHHLPHIADRVISLNLSNYDETPEQINLFLSYIPSFNQFIHLRSLSISTLYSYETLLQLLDQCHHLDNLVRLKFFMCSIVKDHADFQLIVDKIWSLPKLILCDFHLEITNEKTFCIPTITSSSLENIDMLGNKLRWNQINQLFDRTPRLKRLRTAIEYFNGDNYILYPLPTLIKINLLYYHDSNASKIDVLLQNMPNLCHLRICIYSELIDGYRWEQIIRNYLPKLKTFRLFMERDIVNHENMVEKVERLFDSFRGSFWIDEHKWFVRCFAYNKTIYLHTLSGAYRDDEVKLPYSWHSTYSLDTQQELYNAMTTVYNETFFDQPITSNISLPNINYLCINFPINDQFWSIVPNLNRLHSLSISSYIDIYEPQLAMILNRSPKLEILRVRQDKKYPLQTSLLKYTNTLIRELDFERINFSFDNEECLALTHSTLGIQCEVLHIRVDNRENIIYLIENMPNLRALIVSCSNKEYHKKSLSINLSDDEYYSDEDKSSNDEIIQWLKDNLPSTYLIALDPEAAFNKNILIWI